METTPVMPRASHLQACGIGLVDRQTYLTHFETIGNVCNVSLNSDARCIYMVSFGAIPIF